MKQKQYTEILSDEDIIELYFERDEKAISETDKKYRAYLITVAYNILGDISDSEECLSDTYLGAWNSIPPERPNYFKAFLTTIIRRASIKRYHSKRKLRAVPSELTVSLSEIEDFVSAEDEVDAVLDTKKLSSVISDFVRGLSDRRRFIFMGRYFAAEKIDSIANELGISRSTVNKELATIRQALKEKLESEGYLL